MRNGFLIGALLSSAAFGACTGTSPNIVCSAAGPITLTSTGAASGAVPETASVYPSNNTVSGLSGTITSVQVRLNGLTHQSLPAVDMMLLSPSGQAFVFFSDAGDSSTSNQTVTLSDAAGSDLPSAAAIVTGSYRPKNYSNFEDVFPSSSIVTSASNSASPLGSATFASSFNGGNPNGTWKLYISLDSGPWTGSLASWDLIFATAAANLSTTIAITSTANPAQIPLSGSNIITIAATVTSGGNPVTLGAVSFFKGAQALSTNVPLTSQGQATFSFLAPGSAALGEGDHILTVNYSGATGFSSSTANFTQTVDRATQISGNTFCNTGQIALPATTAVGATPYPSKIFVTGLTGTTQSVIMDLKGFSNPATEDTKLLLVSPTGAKFIPFAFISNSSSATVNANIKLDDASGNVLPVAGAVASGTYRPSHGLEGNTATSATFLSPAPGAPYLSPAPFGSASFSSAFAGANPNGTWSLYAVNSGSTGVREIANGWCLTFGTSSDPATTTTSSITPSPSALNQSTTVSAAVAYASNGAPVNAQGS